MKKVLKFMCFVSNTYESAEVGACDFVNNYIQNVGHIRELVTINHGGFRDSCIIVWWNEIE